jgi:O-antigen/teichoic acid export membrane protein
MTPSIYGEYILLLTLIGYLTVISSLNFNQAYGRYIYEENKILSNNLFGGHIFLIILFTFSLISTIIFLIFKSFFDVNLVLIFYAIVISFGFIVETLFTQYCIYSDKLTDGIVFYLFRSFLLLLIIFFFVINGSSLEFIFLIEALFSIIGSIYVIKYLKLKFNFKHFIYTLKYSFNYSLPLLPYTLSLIILSQFDRFVINNFFGHIITGKYSFIYNFGILLSFIFSAFMNFANNDFYKISNELNNQTKFNVHQRKLLFKFIFLSLITVIIFYIISDLIVPNNIKEISNYLPLVISCILISSVWQVWARSLGFHKKTYLIGIAASIPALLYILLLYYCFNIGLDYKSAYFISLFSYSFMTLFGLYFVSKLKSQYVKPFFYDFFWIIAFVAISISSIYYYQLSILIFAIMLLVMCRVKFKYLKV